MPGAEFSRVRQHAPIPSPTPGSGTHNTNTRFPFYVYLQYMLSSLPLTIVVELPTGPFCTECELLSPTFIEGDLHDDAVLGARTGPLAAVGLVGPRWDGRAPAGVGVGGAGAAEEGGCGTWGQAGAAQPRPDSQGHYALLQLLRGGGGGGVCKEEMSGSNLDMRISSSIDL